MDMERIDYLRGELEAERISYGELHEIQSAFEELDPAMLHDLSENASASDMLDELWFVAADSDEGLESERRARKARGQIGWED